jgi:YidC/Oxa1 family membrane protein insertase
MEKRLLISFALSILVLLAYGWLFPSQEPVVGLDTPAPGAITDTFPVETPPRVADLTLPGSVETQDTVATAEAEVSREGLVPADVTTIQGLALRDIVVDTVVYSARFSNRGAVLESIRLREYDDGTGEMLELIGAESAVVTGWPLAITTADPQTNETIANALFVVEQDGNRIRMEYAAEGLSVRKEFRFESDSYTFEVDAQVESNGRPVPFSFVWQGRFGERPAASGTFAGGQDANIVYRDGTAFERLNLSSIETPNDVPATAYVGVEDRYFLAMFMLSDARPPAVGTVEVDSGEDELQPTARVGVPHLGEPIALYVGPQQQEHLAAVDDVLASVIDYGIFKVLSGPMMFVLFSIYGFVGNYGWSIVVFTFFLNIVFFPLRLKQQLSMQKMQKIQPQMRTLQDKFKKIKANDPRKQEVQAEMMGLYKKHGVNPLGSCFPMLLQMPFLIAIFWALQVSVELRQAPWILWIQDLSMQDRYYVLPLLFGAAMFTQQKMMPTSMDPMQAKIMMFMPVMMTFLFRNQASGLMLYWFTSTLFGVGQQYLIKEYWPGAEKPKSVPAPVPAGAVIEAEVVGASEESESNSSESKRRKRRRKK